MEYLLKTKKEMLEFLDSKRNWYINEERNPFTEMKMVSYISNGMQKIQALNVDDNTLIKMYDVNNELVVEISK